MQRKTLTECKNLLNEFFILERANIASSFPDKEDSKFIKKIIADIKGDLKDFVSHHEGYVESDAITIEIEPKNTAPFFGAVDEQSISKVINSIVKIIKIAEAKIELKKSANIVAFVFTLKMPVSGDHTFNLVVNKQPMEKSDIARDIAALLGAKLKTPGHNEDARLAFEINEKDETKKQEEIKEKKDNILKTLKDKYGSVEVIGPGKSSDSQSNKYDTYVISSYTNENYLEVNRPVRIVVAIGKAASDAVEKMQIAKINDSIQGITPFNLKIQSTMSGRVLEFDNVVGTSVDNLGGTSHKADMAFIDNTGEKRLISLKDGDNVKKFQQWSGFTKIIGNPEFNEFVVSVISGSSLVSNGYEIVSETHGKKTKKWLVAKLTLDKHDFFSRISSEETKMTAIYSHERNVNAVFQSNLSSIRLKQIDEKNNVYQLIGDGQVYLNPEIPVLDYEPVFHARASDENVVIEKKYAGGAIFTAVIEKIKEAEANAGLKIEEKIDKKTVRAKNKDTNKIENKEEETYSILVDGEECVGLKINGIRFFVYPIGKLSASAVTFDGKSKDEVLGLVNAKKVITKKGYQGDASQAIKETISLMQDFFE